MYNYIYYSLLNIISMNIEHFFLLGINYNIVGFLSREKVWRKIKWSLKYHKTLK